MPDLLQINAFLQNELSKRMLTDVTAVEAARWLDRARLLKDSSVRPGKPLRDLLRDKAIHGQRQEINGRWFIDYVRPERQGSGQRRHSGDRDVVQIKKHLACLADAREEYRPALVKCLLVAESPPLEDSGRYFYFEDVHKGDSLFWQIMKVIYAPDCPPESSPPRHRKREFLVRLQKDGYFLLDAVEEPLGDLSPRRSGGE